MKNKKRFLTESELEELRHLYENGESIEVICERFGLSKSAANSKLHFYGIKRQVSKYEKETPKECGRLKVLDFERKDGSLYAWVECSCEAKTRKLVKAIYLRRGSIRSCGCLRQEAIQKPKSHGLCRHPLYGVWNTMNMRCKNKDDPRYGGRGISVCDEWRSDFKRFYDWAMENGWEKGVSIERINNDGNYEPKNCKWIPMNEQAWNRRSTLRITAFGETKLAHEWAIDPRCKVRADCLRHRIQKGWSEEEAITTVPIRRNVKKS